MFTSEARKKFLDQIEQKRSTRDEIDEKDVFSIIKKILTVYYERGLKDDNYNIIMTGKLALRGLHEMEVYFKKARYYKDDINHLERKVDSLYEIIRNVKNVVIISDRLITNEIKWCEENVPSKYKVFQYLDRKNYFIFDDPLDAVLFKTFWC